MKARIDQVVSAANTWIVGDDEEVIVVDPGRRGRGTRQRGRPGGARGYLHARARGHDSGGARGGAARRGAGRAASRGPAVLARGARAEDPEIEMEDGGIFEVADVAARGDARPRPQPGLGLPVLRGPRKWSSPATRWPPDGRFRTRTASPDFAASSARSASRADARRATPGCCQDTARSSPWRPRKSGSTPGSRQARTRAGTAWTRLASRPSHRAATVKPLVFRSGGCQTSGKDMPVEQLGFEGMPRRLYACTPTRLSTWLDCPRRYRMSLPGPAAAAQGRAVGA